MRLKRGDTIKIIKGKDNGKTGKILKVLPEQNKILVEGLHLFKKHVRPKKQGEKGEVVMVPRPMSASNVMIMCSNCGKPSRIGHKIEGERKERICKKCNSKI